MKFPAKRVVKTTKTTKNKETSEYPNNYDNKNMEDRRFQWSSRLMTIAFIAMTFVCVGLACTIFTLLPLKQTEPLTVERGDGDAILAQMQPITQSLGGANLIAEDYCMMYVIYRHEIVRSNAVMSARWLKGGFMEAMSSSKEYSRFFIANASILKQIRQADDTIEVHLDGATRTLNPISKEHSGTYQINFTMISRNNAGEEIARRHFLATIEASIIPQSKIPEEQKKINPVGFKVQNYTIANRESLTDTMAQQ